MNQPKPPSNPFPAVIGLIGTGLLHYGIWRIYHPAAFIVAGIGCLVLAWFGRRPSAT